MEKFLMILFWNPLELKEKECIFYCNSILMLSM